MKRGHVSHARHATPLAQPNQIGTALPPVAGNLRRDLRRHVAALDFSAFAGLAQEVLRRSGYQRVVAAGRLSPQGRIMHGGCDLKAYTATDLESVLTAVQLKLYRQPVGRRFVDELRGTMLRLHAEQGLLITTSTFSPAVRAIAQEGEIAPVRLMDGPELIDILVQHRIGIQDKDGQWQVDREFFRRLGETALNPPTGFGACRGGAVPADDLNQHIHNLGPAPLRGSKKGGGMTYPTHVMAGINTLWLFKVLPPTPDPVNFGVLAAAAAFGALLPDLDASESKLKHLSIHGLKPFYLPSQALHRRLGHRGLLHSLLALGIMGLLVLPLGAWWGWPVALAVCLGYASHLAADACTRAGIPLLFPRKRRYHLLPRPLRLVTGSSAEDVLCALAAVAVLALLLSHLATASPFR